MSSNRKITNYVDQSQIDILEQELKEIDDKYPYLASLGEAELHRLRGGIADSVDLFSNKKVKIRAKVHIPVDQYPSVNFVGKLLGPGASTLKGIQGQTNTKMTILGVGVLKNKKEEFQNKIDKKNISTKQKLHLQIDSLGTPAEAYYRLSHALVEVQNCMYHVLVFNTLTAYETCTYLDNNANNWHHSQQSKKIILQELPSGLVQSYHPVAYNWNNYMINSSTYDAYLNKNICRNGTYGPRARGVWNKVKYKNCGAENESDSSNSCIKNVGIYKNGPSGDEISSKTHESAIVANT